MNPTACSTRRRVSPASIPDRRNPNATLSHTDNHANDASSWNTTPTPSGTPSTARPSNSTVPLVGAASPARTSSRVDFPHPEGPITEKNSPRRKSRSIGPNACSAPKLRVTSRRLA